jgi:hypothetical protein
MNGLTMQVFLVDILRQFQPDSLTSVVFGGQFDHYALAGCTRENWPKMTPSNFRPNPNPEILMVNPQQIFYVLGQMYNSSKYYIHRNVWEKVISR